MSFNALKKAGKFILGISPKDYGNWEKIALFYKVYPYTMVSAKRLSNIYRLAESAEKQKIPGAFAECGVWKGGCSAVMAFIAKKYLSGRKLWLFDSFEGLPEPTEEDGQAAKGYARGRAEGKLSAINECVGPLEDVKKIFFELLDINPAEVIISKGWFQNTLPVEKHRIGKIAILRLDGDWYASTKTCLENLYDNVVPGGYVVIDDYVHWAGCKKAVDEFLAKKNITAKLITIDETGVYFQKP